MGEYSYFGGLDEEGLASAGALVAQRISGHGEDGLRTVRTSRLPLV
jgi:hypothetical protein